MNASMLCLPVRAPHREAVLYLAALDGWMRSGRPTSDRVRHACIGLRAAIERDEHRVAYSLSGVDREAAARWMARLEFEVAALGAVGSSAVAWAAVDAWNDMCRAPWTRFAEAARRLAEALEPEGMGVECARAGARLREVVR